MEENGRATDGTKGTSVSSVVLDTVFFSVWQVLEDFVTRAEAEFPELDIGPLGEPDCLLKLAMGAWDDPNTDGEKSAATVADWLDGTFDRDGAPLLFVVIDTVIAYCTQALKSEDRGEVDLAWKYLADARYWQGIMNAVRWMFPLLTEKENPAAQMAKKRHAWNAAEKAKIIEYWRSNLDPSLSDLAPVSRIP